jgi:hypothetical protein
VSDQKPNNAPAPQAAHIDDTANQPPQPGWQGKFVIGLVRVGKLRDGLLVAGGLLYILGYIVWSVNAQINGLGLLPALEFQYLVAGIIPALIIGLAALFIRILLRTSRLERSVRADEGGAKSALKSKKSKWTALAIILISVTLCAMVIASVYIIYTRRSLPTPSGGWAKLLKTVAAIIPGALGALSGLLQATLKARTGGVAEAFDDIERSYRKILLVGFSAAGSLVFLLLWTLWVYPKVPQALGGVKPRCAQLDLVEKDISTDTIKAVAPGAQTEKTSPAPEAGDIIVRSDQVFILFSGSDYVLIKNAQGRVYELKKDVVHAVTACADNLKLKT